MPPFEKIQGSSFYLSVTNTHSDKIAEILISSPIKDLWNERKGVRKRKPESDTQTDRDGTRER